MKPKAARAGARRSSRATSGGVTMPPEYQELLTAGHLAPEPNGMKCAGCGQPVSLFFNHDPAKLDWKNLPGGVWGKDVSVVCPCCSFSHCTHKGAKAER